MSPAPFPIPKRVKKGLPENVLSLRHAFRVLLFLSLHKSKKFVDTMQPVNCFWVGLGVCSSYHSEKEKERFIVEEKKKTAALALIVGGVFSFRALLQLNNVFAKFSVLALLWVLAYAALAAVFFLKKRNASMIASFALLTVLQLVSFIQGFGYDRYTTWGGSLDIFRILGAFLRVVTSFYIMCLATANFTSKLQQYKENLNKLWFLPAVFLVLALIFPSHDSYIPYIFYVFLYFLLDVIAFTLCSLWIAYPENLPKFEAARTSINGEKKAYATGAAPAVSEAYCDLVKHILLLLFTFGIWHYIWVYRMTRYTNAVEDEEPRNPTNKLLLCLFVPFYLIYWTYKTAQRVDKMAAAAGISSDLSMLCLILEIFLPIIPPILLQEKMNSIVFPDVEQAAPAQAAPHKAATALGTAEELKTYKELLDTGVITQEEFDAKKKQLLGL